MRQSRGFLVRLAFASLIVAGCQKPYFMTEQDYVYYNQVSGDYDHQEYDSDTILPEGTWRTVRDPGDKVQWKLSLEESKRLTLSNNKQIAFLGFQPGQAGALIELRESAFDANFEIGAGWSRTDQQVATNIQTFGTGQNALQQDLFGLTAGQGGFGFNSTSGGATQDFASSVPGADVFNISKRNATGGLTRFSYSLGYTMTDPVSSFTLINPSWQSLANFTIEQPLLQHAGVEFNRALILIARAGHEQSIKNFQANVQTLLRDVETAYWQLYFTYQDLYSREVGMKQALATWQKEKNKQEVGTGAIPDVAQAREQFEFFRAARVQALSRVLAAERDLRRVMGLPPDDDRQIVPAQEPTIAEFFPNKDIAIMDAMELRPELSAQRFAIRSAELEVMRQKNGLLPDLTVYANYGLSGLEDEFDQSIDRLTDHRFTNWTLGVRLRRPIGERAAHASTRRARLSLSEQRATLRNLEHNLLHDVHEAYQNLITNYELIQVQKDRREAATAQLEAREQFYRQGKTTIDVLLQAQTTFADALRDESQAIVQYNQSLIQWEWVQGTILANDNVVIAEENISLMSEKTLRQRREQRCLPLPIHQGTPPQPDCPPDRTPLYPERLMEIPLEPEPTDSKPAELAPMPTAKPVPSAQPQPAPAPTLKPLPPPPSQPNGSANQFDDEPTVLPPAVPAGRAMPVSSTGAKTSK